MSIPKLADTAPTLRPPTVTATGGMIISASFSVSGFSKRWSHCHQMANFLARYVSANEDDPERHSTLLSTFFNELLEALYRNHDGTGDIKLRFERKLGSILVTAEVPVTELATKFFEHVVQLISQPDPMSWYRDLLEHDAPGEEVTAVGLLELAVVYGSKLRIVEPTNGNSLIMSIEFPFTEVDEA